MELLRVSTPLTREAKLAVCPVADVEAQARVPNSGEGDLIASYIEAAYDFLSGPDGWLGHCCLLEEEWEFYGNPIRSAVYGSHFELPMRPVRSLTSFEVLSGGVYGAVGADLYRFLPSDTFGRLNLVSGRLWPFAGLYDPRAYRARFKAGFGTADDVPSPIKLAIKMLAAHHYRQRETAGEAQPEVAYGLKSLAGRYRIGPDHS